MQISEQFLSKHSLETVFRFCWKDHKSKKLSSVLLSYKMLEWCFLESDNQRAQTEIVGIEKN